MEIERVEQLDGRVRRVNRHVRRRLEQRLGVVEDDLHARTDEIVGRALSYAGIALGLGTAFFVLFVAPASVDPRRESSLLLIGGGLIVAGSLALMVDQGAKLPPRLNPPAPRR